MQDAQTNTMSLHLLRWMLYALAVYFLAISAAHLAAVKWPLLFVYFDVPSHAYQDRIISFLALGWSVFIFTAARGLPDSRSQVRAIVIASFLATLGLSLNNAVTDFQALASGLKVWAYWAQTGALAVITLLLAGLYWRGFR